MKKKIGLLLISTGKYFKFVQPLIDSADKFFLVDQEVTYFLFTDSQLEFKSTIGREIKIIEKRHQAWPFATLLRYNTFWVNKDHMKDMDYLFYCDVDMLFVDFVGDEILSDRVATIHPGFLGGRGTPETNPASSACVRSDERMVYYAGGFNGGSKDEFLKMSNQLNTNIKNDLDKNVIAVWHDESHFNRYCINNAPTKVLSPSYCYPESWKIPYDKKLLALDKNHAEIRKEEDEKKLKCAVIFYHKNIYKIYKKEWINKCVDSILKQTYKDYDIFEINYNSFFGGSYSIFDNIQIGTKKLTFYDKKFDNHAQAMNFLITEVFSMGYDVVFNTNLDDYYSLDRFEKQLDYIKSGYDIVSSDFSYISEIEGHDTISHDLVFSSMNIKERLDINHNVIAHPCVAMSKNFWTKLRYDDKSIPREDLELWQKGINEGYKFFIIPKNLLYYRLHQNQISNKQKA